MSHHHPTRTYISWDDFHKDTLNLAEKLQAHAPYKGLVVVARGGLAPASLLARALNIRTIETVCIASYDGETQGNLNILKPLQLENQGQGWLVIDDLVDSGATAEVVREMFPKALFATVYAKPQGKALTQTFVREFPQDCWLVFPWDQ